MTAMKAQVAAAASGSVAPTAAGASESSMLDLIKNAAASGSAAAAEDVFKPRFPGNKVMEKDGLGAQQEGVSER
ncbi:hypothetical protein PINS_up011399 [Pythium insidiosum]|nr:hypothetical protein PINS_up011399 [Pythium insidiosum]